MFEHVVQQLLSGYLSRYVKGLQREHFKIALWKGEVVLENAELILEAFDYLQLSFSIKTGRIGRLSIKIPWTKLGWDPIVISLDDVFICTCAHDDSEWASDLSERKEFAAKKAKLATAELAKLSRRVCENQTGQSFISYVSAKILDNIQVYVRNVHVIYVDGTTDSTGHFIFGFQFSSLSVTTDTKSKMNYGRYGGQTKGAQVCKSLDILGFSIYWNAWPETSKTEVGLENVPRSQLCCDKVPDIDQYGFLLAPFDASFSLMVNKTGKVEKGIPHYCIMSELGCLVFSLNDVQLQQILMLLDSFLVAELRRKYGRYRPWHNPLSKKLSGWQTAWWHYAQHAILSDVRRRLRKTSWSNLGKRITLRHKYVDLYKRKLVALKEEQPVAEAIVYELDQLEKECDIEDILSYRAIAETQLQELLMRSKFTKQEVDGSSSLKIQKSDDLLSRKPRGWLNWLSLGMLGAGGTSNLDQFAGVLSDEIVEDIYEVTKFSPIPASDNSLAILEKSYLSSLSINFHQIVLLLINKTDQKEAVSLLVHDVSLECNLWGDSARITSSVNALQLVDPWSFNIWLSDSVEQIVHDKHLENARQAFMDSQMEVAFGDNDLSLSIKVELLPFEVVYDAEPALCLLHFSNVFRCFESYNDMILYSLDGFESTKTRVSKKAEFAVLNHPKVRLDINVKHMLLRVPLPKSACVSYQVVFELRELILMFDPKERNLAFLEMFDSSEYNPALLEELYDDYNIKLANLEGRILVAGSSKWVPTFHLLDALVSLRTCIIQERTLKQLEVIQYLKGQLKVHADVQSISLEISPPLYNAVLDLQNRISLDQTMFELAKKGKPKLVSVQELHSKFDAIEQFLSPDKVNTVLSVISIAVKSLTLRVATVDDYDSDRSITLILSFTDLSIVNIKQTVVQKLLIYAKGIEATTSGSRSEHIRTLICSNRDNSKFYANNNDFEPYLTCNEKLGSPSAEEKFTFHYTINSDANATQCGVMIGLSDVDIHCYPYIFGQLLELFDRITKQGSDLPTYSIGNFSSEADLPKSNGTARLGDQWFGFSNFCMNGSSHIASFPFYQFPFLTIRRGSTDSLENSIIFGSDDWRKILTLKCKSSSLSVNNLESKQGISMASSMQPLVSAIGSSYDVQLVLELGFSGTRVYFHDCSDILATMKVPALRAFSSCHKPGNFDLLISVQGLEISSWTRYSDECLFGPSLPTHPSILNIRVQKKYHSALCAKLELSFSFQHVYCILSSEFLAILIGYFSLPDWRSINKEQPHCSKREVESKHSELFYKFEVLDSALVLTSEENAYYPLEMGIQQIYFTFVPKFVPADLLKKAPSDCVFLLSSAIEMVQSINVLGQGLSLSLIILKDDMQIRDVQTCLEHISLIETCSVDLSVRIPRASIYSAQLPLSTTVMAYVHNIDVVATDMYFLYELDAIMNAAGEMTSIGMQSRCFTSNVPAFRNKKKSLNNSVNLMPEISVTDVKICIKSLSAKLMHCASTTTSCKKLIAETSMGIDFIASFQNEIPSSLDLSISDFIFSSASDSFLLMSCNFGDIQHACIGVRMSLSDELKQDIFLDIPSVHIWLHFVLWMEVLEYFSFCAARHLPTQSENSMATHLGSGQSSSLPKSKSSQFSPVTSFATSKAEHAGPFVGVSCQSKCMCIMLHFPFQQRVEGDGSSVELEVPLEPETGCQHPPSKSKICKYILFTILSRDTELSIIGGDLKIKSIFEKVEGRMETMENILVHSIPFFQILHVNISLEETMYQDAVQAYVDAHLEALDVWFSYDTFYFCNDIHCLTPKVTSSHDLSFTLTMKVYVNKSTVLLSDGKLSFSGPIAELLTRNLSVSISQDQEAFHVSLEGGIRLNYNNIHKVAWEPFLEPWGFQLMLLRKLEKDDLTLTSSYGTEIHLMSVTPLNVNITESLFQVIHKGMEVINGGLRWSGVANTGCQVKNHILHVDDLYKRRHAPYVIQNDTSLPFVFWIFEDSVNSLDRDTVEADVGHLVPPGCSFPIYVAESREDDFFSHRLFNSFDRLEDKKSSSAQHRTISIQFDGTSSPSTPISLDLVSLSYFEVDFYKASDVLILEEDLDDLRELDKIEKSAVASDMGFTVPVVFEVCTQHHSKLIRLYSTVIFLNATPMPLELRFDIPFGISPKILDPILPGQEFPLPLHLAESGRMRWRPLGSDYLWSEVQTLSNILQRETRHGILKSFVCYPSLPISDPFRCCVSVKDIPISPSKVKKLSSAENLIEVVQPSNILKGRFIRQVKLATPLAVKNHLPVALKFKIVSGGVSPLTSLAEVATAYISHVDSSHDLGVTFYLDGFQPFSLTFPRAEVFVATSRSSDGVFSSYEAHCLSPDMDEGGAPIFVDIEKAMDAQSGARELSLSVPYLLYNCTGLVLVIADADSGKRENARLIPSSYSLLYEKQVVANRCSLLSAFVDEEYSVPLSIINSQDPHQSANRISKRKRPSCSPVLHKHFHTTTSSPCGENIDYHKHDARDPTSGFANKQNSNPQNQGSDSSRFSNLGSCDENEGRGSVCAYMYSSTRNHSFTETMVTLAVCETGSTKPDLQGNKWSSPFFLNPASGSTSVVIPQPGGLGAFIVSVTSNPVSEAFLGRSRKITFQPRFVISNACSKDLCYKQKGCDSFYFLGIGRHSHLHWSDATRELLVSIRFDESGWEWSGCFLPDQFGDTLVKMHNYMTGASNMVRVEVQNADLSKYDKMVGCSSRVSGSYLILLSEDNTGFMPYRIDNFSIDRLRVYQHKCENFDTIVHPYTSCPYAWDEPHYPHRLIIEVPGQCFVGSYNIDDVRDYPPIRLPTLERPGRSFFLSIHAEGAIKVLSIMDLKFHSPNDMLEPGLHSLKRKKAIDQLPDKNYFNERMTVTVPFIGISLVDSTQELIFASVTEFKIEVLQSLQQQKLYIELSSLQIDNQLHNTLCPIMLSIDNDGNLTSGKRNVDHCRSTDENLALGLHDGFYEPALFFMATKWRSNDNLLVSFQNISLRLAPVRLELEEQCLLCLVDFFHIATLRLQECSIMQYRYATQVARHNTSNLSCGNKCTCDVWSRKPQSADQLYSLESPHHLKNDDITSYLPSVVPIGAPWQQIFLLARKQRKMYVEGLHISPFQLTISFSSSPWLQKDAFKLQKPLILLSGNGIMRVLMALVDIEEAPVHLRQLTIMHHLASWESIQDIATRHYTRQLLQELYKVFGSAGVIGNPMGFARNVGHGIKEFILVTAKGVWQSPRGLVKGIVYGSRSLLGNTIYALSSAMTQFSKAAHKGVVAFAFDEQFVTEMERRNKYQGSNTKGILDEILEGLTGLLQSPIQGAEKHGLPGVLSGMVSGTARLIARPVASVLEVTGRTAMSIRNHSGPHQAKRFCVRFPRPVSMEYPLLPYSLEDAVALSLLRDVDKSHLGDESLVICKALNQAGKFVLVTQRLILVVRCSSLAARVLGDGTAAHGPEWSFEIEIELERIIHIDADGTILNIVSTSMEMVSRQQRITHSLRTAAHSIPLVHTSMELSSREAAAEVLQILLTTINDQKRRTSRIRILHRNMLR